MDGDGQADLVTVNSNLHIASVFRNISNSDSIALSPKIDFATGLSPYSVTVGDLDGDGRLDLAVANGAANTVSIYMNTSTGVGNISFASKVDLATGLFPFCVVIGDFDLDGKPDLAVANSKSSNVSLLKNNSTSGNFSFLPKIDFATGAFPFWLAISDLDSDGKPDLATANGIQTGTVSVLRNTSIAGTISFAPKADFDGSFNAYSIVFGDLDGDGKPDLITTGEGSFPLAIRLNTTTSAGNISFGPRASSFFSGGASYGVSLSDLDGDSKPDIVVTNSVASSVFVLKNTSIPGSLALDPKVNYVTGTNPWVSALVDLDNDGKPEIVTANQLGSNITVLKNRVDAPSIISIDPMTGGYGSTISITGNNFNDITGVYFGGVPADSFKIISPNSLIATVGNGHTGNVVVTGTFGKDSFAGFAFTEAPTIESFYPFSGGTGTVVNIVGTNLNNVNEIKFGNTTAMSFTINSAKSVTAVVGIVDSTLMRVTVSNSFGNASRNGFYAGPSITSFSPKSGPIGTVVTITGFHFNSDISKNKVFFGSGMATVIEASFNSLKVVVPDYSSFDVITVISDSLMAFSGEPFIVTFPSGNTGLNNNSLVLKGTAATGQYPISISKADFDLDGKTDLVVANYMAGSFSILKNTSSPGFINFKSKIDFTAYPYLFKIATGDIDADGKPDVIVLNKEINTVSIFRNTTINGLISFAAGIEFATSSSPIDISINDMDRDGKPDLVILNEGTSVVSVLRNTSSVNSISFQPRFDYYTLGIANSLATGDLNGDGKPEILVTNGILGKFSVFKNMSIAGESFSINSFEKTAPSETGFSPESIAIADFDSDGVLDVGVSNKGNETISIFKNNTTDFNISFDDKVDYYFGDNSANSNRINIAAGDMDGDGMVDIYFPGYLNNNTIFRNLGSSGNLSFSLPINCFSGDGSSIQGRFVLTDLDGDGKPDVALADQEFSKISFFRNRVGEKYSLCNDGNMILKANLSGLHYKWEVSTGTAFVDIVDDINYSGTNTSILSLRNVPSSWSENNYRCIVDGNAGDIYSLSFENYWQGAASTSWGNSANWSCSKIPDSGTDVIINSGTIIVDSNVTVRSLTVKPGANITVNSGVRLTVLH